MHAGLSRLFRLSLLGICLVAAPTGVRAEDDEEEFTPRTGTPSGNRIGGASRGPDTGEAVTVTLLAPAKTVGLTMREQPVIHWYLSGDTSKPIEVVITDPTSLENPVLETTLKGEKKAGVHRLDLSKVKQDGKPVKLRPGVKYELVVEVAADEAQASQNANAACKIMRIDPKDAPAGVAKEKDPAKRAAAYGKAGLWFDYLDAINAAIEADKDNAALVQRRAKALAAERLVWEADGRITELPEETPAGQK